MRAPEPKILQGKSKELPHNKLKSEMQLSCDLNLRAACFQLLNHFGFDDWFAESDPELQYAGKT